MSIILAFYDNFDIFSFFFHFFLFLTKKLKTSKLLKFVQMQYLPCHDWFLHMEKNPSDFEEFWGFKCVPTTNSCFLTDNEITRDFNNILVKMTKTHYILMFLKNLHFYAEPFIDRQPAVHTCAKTLNQTVPTSLSYFTILIQQFSVL